jgi:hypothetical protein
MLTQDTNVVFYKIKITNARQTTPPREGCNLALNARFVKTLSRRSEQLRAIGKITDSNILR